LGLKISLQFKTKRGGFITYSNLHVDGGNQSIRESLDVTSVSRYLTVALDKQYVTWAEKRRIKINKSLIMSSIELTIKGKKRRRNGIFNAVRKY
jgi:hypothetical protein